MENEVIDKSFEEVPNGISCCLYKGYPRLYMQCSKQPQFVYDPHWYKDIEYVKDQERGERAEHSDGQKHHEGVHDNVNNPVVGELARDGS
jgi:hypothetical protein